MAQKDYLSQLLQNMHEQQLDQAQKLDKLTDKMDKVYTQALKTNGRVTGTEKEIADLKKVVKTQATKTSLIALPDSKLAYLALLVAALLLMVIARVIGLDVGNLL